LLKNRIAYGIVVVMLLLFVYLYESEMTYMALYAVLLLPVVSFVLTVISRRQFSMEEELTRENIVRGEDVAYIFRVRNNSFLPCANVRVRFKANSSAIETDFRDKYFYIGPRKVREDVFRINAKYRGVYEMGVASILLYDFLGLFKFEQSHSKVLALTVRPRILHLHKLPLVTATQGLDTAKNFTQEEDYSEISDLRKYQPTDGYKKIHWKVSAKRGELLSKNYQALKRNTAALVIDNFIDEPTEDALAMEDAVMEAAVSVLSHASRLQYLVSLHYMGGSTAGGSFEYLYSAASAIQFDKLDFDNFLPNFEKMQTDAENVVIFAQKISESLYACCASLRIFGNNVIVFHFGKHNAEEERRLRELQELRINCISFDDIKAGGA